VSGRRIKNTNYESSKHPMGCDSGLKIQAFININIRQYLLLSIRHNDDSAPINSSVSFAKAIDPIALNTFALPAATGHHSADKLV